MPGKTNGVDLARWIHVHCPGTAVLLQTGYAEFDTGDFPVLRKPFDGAELEHAIKALLDARHASS
jgi:DNA-binding response OmpR family regulator